MPAIQRRPEGKPGIFNCHAAERQTGNGDKPSATV
jgi:hypothetical protein